ncbi:MAG TPA: zinc-ribbon domain-containing protein [Tepidisphaeraceae bacterium]|nr:zinc-ribbon domain-containing protein [Tepidisphaeraceae bacterium]
MPRRRHGFILLFGSRNIVSDDRSVQPVQAVCPNCNQQATIVGKTYRNWFTLFFLPVFPMGKATAFSQCTNCGGQFPVTVDDLRRGLARNDRATNQEAIALYNSMRTSPANAITLNQLMLMYAGMNEYDQAISAAREFPAALDASEQCMCTLGRVYLAAEKRPEAIGWFATAIARNPQFGEAHYYKAIAHLTSTPPEFAAAVSHARAARSAAYPNADALLKEAESKARGE